jgi:hypothetical protein
MNWAAEEFSTVDLKDKRLNKRLIKIVETLSDQPVSSIPMACNDWGQTAAVYRFFDQARNPKRPLTWDQILMPHINCTVDRMHQCPVVLCLQDTTELNFNGQEIEGLGRLSYDAQRGMYLHATYAVTPDREPLGVLDAWMWSREKKKPAPGEKKAIVESERWVEGYDRIAERALSMPNTRLIYIGDRESDISAVMRKAHQLDYIADLIIRSSHNRVLPDEEEKLWDMTTRQPALGCIRFTMPARAGKKEREVMQEIFVGRGWVSDGKKGLIPITCVIAREINAPEGIKPVEWRLITNREVPDLAEAMTIIQWYLCRWEIEIFFHVLKNGCRIEALQLNHVSKIELALVVYMVVAWRLARMTKLARTQPNMLSNELFSDLEWQGAYLLAEKEPPKEPPTLREVIRQIASLGGFLGRKHDGEPGVKSLWLGFARLRDFVAGTEYMQRLQSCV